MRGASVLFGLHNRVTLHTTVGFDLLNEFQKIADLLPIQLETVPAATTTWFRYRHPLARPDIFPAIQQRGSLTRPVKAEHALVYGMLEGRPPVAAKRVVYDPQNGRYADAFQANGSTAGQLAVVASYSEGVALTGRSSPDAIVTGLLRDRGCAAAVLKCGARGALVATRRSREWITPFPTDRVWKIGSGDIFSAAFAHAWLQEGRGAIAAGWFASRMVAAYVGSRRERFTNTELAQFRTEAAAASRKRVAGARKLPRRHIYIAAPFFTTAEQWMVDEARAAFSEMGFNTFSPIHDVGEGSPREVVPADLEGLRKSGLVFALLDGLDPGTLFEIGYARALQIPVVSVCAPVMERSVTMLLGSGCSVVDDFATGIYAACWKMMGDV